MTRLLFILPLLLLALLLPGCASPGKLQNMQQKQVAASLALSRTEQAEERRVIASGQRDTIKVTDADGGNELILMKAVRDDETGEMVASEVIDAAVITARFRNVAERHGRVDLRFEVIVPKEMMDPRWQLVFYPDMFLLEDSLRLEPILVTGSEFRRRQLRGYELYEKYLSGIITDSAAFVDRRNLTTWIRRNLPDLYRFREDSSYVDEAAFHSRFGATEAQAVLHYTQRLRKEKHQHLWNERGRKFDALVKVPIQTEGIRLDTVLRDTDSNFVYQYTQTITTRPKLRKVDIVLSGEIFEQEHQLYTMPRSAPLSFYISSLSSFVDERERYLDRVVERRAAAHSACYVDFAKGKADIDLSLGHNRDEIGRIRSNILELLGNETFDMDSIVIAASASPEGDERSNTALARLRAAAVADYFERYVRHYRDSARRAARGNLVLELGEDGKERWVTQEAALPQISFRSHSNGENWDYLSVLVDEDSLLTAADKKTYISALEISDLDLREAQLQKMPSYTRVREQIYPRLRTVRFDFHLHRKGMVKDTVHTTELDTLYMNGIRLLKDRDYRAALAILRDYRDYNTAIAYVSLDYNASAMAILRTLEPSPPVQYMTALLHARNGDDEKAVRCYLQACKADPAYVFRGNLDPEIYILIQRYGLNRQEDDSLTTF